MKKKKLATAIDTFLVVLRMCKLIFNPKEISSIFKGKAFRNHKSMQLALASLRSKPEVAALMSERYLAAKPADLDELSNLPEGSLGQVFAKHMKKYELEVVFYPPVKDKEDDDIKYMRMRARQTHDIHHVVLGMPAVEIGEMSISAFYLAQNKIPLSALLIGFGFLYTILRQPYRIEELVNAIFNGWHMGKKAKDFLGVKWEDYWDMPIEDVRRMVNVDVDPEFFEKIAAPDPDAESSISLEKESPSLVS